MLCYDNPLERKPRTLVTCGPKRMRIDYPLALPGLLPHHIVTKAIQVCVS